MATEPKAEEGSMTDLQAAQMQRQIWLDMAQNARIKVQQCLSDIDTIAEVANNRVAVIQSKLMAAKEKAAPLA